MIHVVFNDNPEDHPDFRGWCIVYKDADGAVYDAVGAYDTEAEASRLAGLDDDVMSGRPIDNMGCA